MDAPLPLPAGWQLRADRVSYVVYPSRSYFDSSLWEAHWRADLSAGPIWLQGSGGYGVDIGNGARAGGDRHGLLASLSARAALGAACWVNWAASYQSWAGARSHSPGLIDVARRQHTQLLRAMVSLPLSKEHGLLSIAWCATGKIFPCLPTRAVACSWAGQWQFGR